MFQLSQLLSYSSLLIFAKLPKLVSTANWHVIDSPFKTVVGSAVLTKISSNTLPRNTTPLPRPLGPFLHALSTGTGWGSGFKDLGYHEEKAKESEKREIQKSQRGPLVRRFICLLAA